MRGILGNIHGSEEGHVHTLPGVGLSIIGIVGLAIGAATDTDWLTIAGGVVAAVGTLVLDILRHTRLDWAVFSRLDKLEKR